LIKEAHPVSCNLLAKHYFRSETYCHSFEKLQLPFGITHNNGFGWKIRLAKHFAFICLQFASFMLNQINSFTTEIIQSQLTA